MSETTTPAADLDGLALQRAKLIELFNVATSGGPPHIQRSAAHEVWQIIDGLLSAHRALLDKLNTPEVDNFVEGITREAAHQVERWGAEHDAGKTPADWFWLVGYLAGKALTACLTGDRAKALHHCVSSAAALANWHRSINGQPTAMRPGIDPTDHGLSRELGGGGMRRQHDIKAPDGYLLGGWRKVRADGSILLGRGYWQAPIEWAGERVQVHNNEADGDFHTIDAAEPGDTIYAARVGRRVHILPAIDRPDAKPGYRRADRKAYIARLKDTRP